MLPAYTIECTMLVLSRQRDESIIIGDNIVITVVDVRGDKVRHEGSIIESEEENLRILRDNMEKITTVALPLWRRLGAL